MDRDDEFLDEHVASQEPLLGQHDTPRKSKPQTWYRSRPVKVLGVSVVLLIVIFALVSSQIQRIASAAIKTTQMSINRMDLSLPKDSSVVLNLSLELTSTSPFAAYVEPVTFLILYQDQTVGSFLSPAMKISHGVSRQVFPNSTLQITNRTAWDQFAGDMMRRESMQYQIQGRLNIHVRMLGFVKLSASDVPLEKSMTLQGMNGLKEMQIAEVDMTESTQMQVLARIKTCVRNPSITTIHPVGALCLMAHYPRLGNDTLIAHLTTPADTNLAVANSQPSHPYCASLSDTGGVDMSTGYNLLALYGEMLDTNSEAISGLITKYLSNVSAPLTVVTCDPRATSVGLFNQAMHNLTISSALPPQKEPLVGNMFFQGISLHAPEEGKENKLVRLGTAVKVETTSPLGLHSALTVSKVRMGVNLVGAGISLGSLSTVSAKVLDGKLVGRSNISVDCLTELTFVDRGEPFGKFVRASVVMKKVKLSLAGHMDVVCHGALGTLKLSGLPLLTTTTLNGMDNFLGVSVESFFLPGTDSSTEHGERIEAHIQVPNPSVFSVSVGTLAMELNLNDPREEFGILRGMMDLRPGGNELQMTGNLKPTTDASGQVSTGVARFFSRYLQGSSSQLVAKIASTQYGNCVWMQEALLGLTIGTTFPGVSKEFQMISNIKMNQLDVILDEALPEEGGAMTNTRMRVRTDMRARVKMPASIRIPLQIPNLSVVLALENASGVHLGSLVSGREVCEFNQSDDGVFRLNMSHFYQIGFNDQKDIDGMSDFIDCLLTNNGSIMMRLASDIHANQGAFPDVKTRMGVLALSGIPVTGEPLIPAMDSFRHPPVRVLSIDIQQGKKSSMMMTMEFSLQNPSIVQTKLGALVLDVYFDGTRMGSAKISDFSLNCCGQKTILKGSFEYNPRMTDLAIAERFLSNFVSGFFTHGSAQEITIRGSAKSTSLDLLRPAMKTLSIPSKLPTLAELFPATPTLVTSSLLYIPSLFHLAQIPTALELRNPFSESITVTMVDLELYPCEDQVSEDNRRLKCKKYFSKSLARFSPAEFQPIFIPSNTNGCFSCCEGKHCEDHVAMCPRASVGQCVSADMQSFLTPEAITTIIHSLMGGLLMRVNGTIGASIGDYSTRLFYQQDGLLVTMAK